MATRKTTPRIMPLTVIDKPLTNRELSARIFGGELLMFSHPAAMKKMLRAARRLATNFMHPARPLHAHRQYEKESFFCRTDNMQKKFNTPPFKKMFADCLREIGLDTDAMFWDTLGLRIAPPAASHDGGFRSHIGAHRDTWGTAIPAQINWWAPIWRLSLQRTMGFYPGYWRRPLMNTTAEWSFEEFLRARKESKIGRRPSHYPPAPAAIESPDEPPSPLIMPPGALLAFSAAHLHSSIANTTELARYSLEIRTVDENDLRNNRGAPNADCHSAPPLTRLFRAIADDRPLSSPPAAGGVNS